MARPTAAIVGPGRMGQGIALALKRRGYAIVLLGRGPRPVQPGLDLQVGHWGDAVAASELVLVAVPDDAIEDVARRLADEGVVGSGHAVLHLSGLKDRSALSVLDATGAALGSFHPLQTVADPATAAERLKGVYVGIEGDARAIDAADRLAKTLRMTPVVIPAAAKPAYHAAAVMAANFTIALAGTAQRIAESAGVPPDITGKIYLPLLQGAVANIVELGAVRALTGPVRRGDVTTIEGHLRGLGPDDQALYRLLSLAALDLAIKAGLEPDRVAAVRAALSGDGPPARAAKRPSRTAAK